MEDEKEYVIKSNGLPEEVDMNKIKIRLENLKKRVEVFTGTQLHINVARLARLTVSRMRNNVTTAELDELAADTASFISDHPDYQKFGGAILASNLESSARLDWKAYLNKAYFTTHEKTKKHSPLISKELYDIGMEFADQIEARIVRDRNMLFDYFGMSTLLKGKYMLLQYVNDQPIVFEDPQHMWMRISIGLYSRNLVDAFELYDVLSKKEAILASPTLFHAGTPFPQLSSCFLLDMPDSIGGIYDTIKQTALISKHAGGVGIALNKVRCSGSHIASTNGTSNGIMPLLKVLNATAQYVDQGGGKRKGSFAPYLSPWHADIFQFLEMKETTGAEELRARDLFQGLWISDEFMRRVSQQFKSGAPVMWSLFDPNVATGLDELFGDEFTQAYKELEEKKLYVRQVPAKDVWVKIVKAMIQSGIPYILAKDSCNEKNNQKNLGTLHSSNLCTEILEYTSETETAVCNLCSISLPAFLTPDGKFGFEHLYKVCRIMTRALNQVIDVNYYPTPESELSNMQHRPVGMGIQGLGTLFQRMRTKFTSKLARKTNLQIAETMYFGALSESHALAVRDGCYPSMDRNGGAPIRKGILQQDMWKNAKPPDPDLGWNWPELRENVKVHGVRNSLLIAHMPTASTSQILGNSECFEPYYTNLFVRKTKVSEFMILNGELVAQLSELGMWTNTVDPVTGNVSNLIKDALVANDGSIQTIEGIPKHIKKIFRTVWEVKLEDLTDMLADRSQYIDQSSSVNVHFLNQDQLMPKITKYLFYAWLKGLKTLSYYTRTKQKKMVITEQSVKAEPACTSCSA